MYISETPATASECISIMIVEDHDVTRLGLKLGLSTRPNLKVVAEAADGNTAVKNAMNFKPQVILMDIGLPEMNGIDATKRVKEFDPSIRVIMFTTHHSDKALFDALAAGADGYCLKTVSFEQLDMAISTVKTGAAWLDPGIASRVLRSKAALHSGRFASEGNGQPAPAADQAVRSSLSPAEIIDSAFRESVAAIEAMAGVTADKPITAAQTVPPTMLCSDELRRKLDPKQKQVVALVESGVTYQEISNSTGVPLQEIQSIMCELLRKMVSESNDNTPAGAADLADPIAIIPDSEFSSALPEHGADTKSKISARLSPKELIDGKYEVLEVLGAGGMSTVYKANNILINKIVAIKVLHKHLCEDIQLVRRFQVEARAASSLNHQNILTIFDLGTTSDGQPYLVMDNLDGSNLNQLLEENGPLELRRGINIFKQVCEALMVAHEKNIVHRDLKPSNIMLVNSNSRADHVKIIDFGIAKVEQEDANSCKLTKTGEVIGSIAYMSPEQCMGKGLDWRSDIYSLGCTMYEAFTGSPVFSGSVPFQVLSKHVSEMPQRFSRLNLKNPLPIKLEALIFKTLMKEPSRRHQSARELRDALQELLKSLS